MVNEIVQEGRIFLKGGRNAAKMYTFAGNGVKQRF